MTDAVTLAREVLSEEKIRHKTSEHMRAEILANAILMIARLHSRSDLAEIKGSLTCTECKRDWPCATVTSLTANLFSKK